MASEAPSHGCHGEPGTAQPSSQNKGWGRGWGVRGRGGGSFGWLLTGVTTQTSADDDEGTPGATGSELMMCEIGYI